MDITLLIPTLNRPELMIRELRYYQSLNFKGKIRIGDSSDAPAAKVITDSLSQFAGSLEIYYDYLPSCEPASILQILGEKATTSYVAFIADDDFLVPAEIGKCVGFLDANPDYVAAHGLGIIVSSSAGFDVSAGYYRQPIIEGATAAQRLTDHVSHYSVSLFSVHRIDAWRAMFKDVTKLKDKTFGSELLPCCHSVIEGKIKQLDGLYLIRQDHNQRYQLPSWFEWITNEDWRSSYLTFRERLAEAVARQDGISLDEARKTVTHAFSIYMATYLSSKTSRVSAKAPLMVSWQRQIAQKIPGARKLWRGLRSLRDWLNHSGTPLEAISLQTLLESSSPYHDDFMPVYYAITNHLSGETDQ